jgi:tRNA(His) guanylyltransferase
MSKMNDLGTRMKEYEAQTTSLKLMSNIPIMVRLDGKNFSKFTKDLEDPYDKRLSDLMIETTKYLVKETNANCSYTQSDEISMVFYNDDINSQTYYNGKLFKILTDLSAMCSVYFNYRLKDFLPEKIDSLPRFDCRAWNVPNLDEAVNSFLWREQDCTKNSISMAAMANNNFSHEELQGKSGNEKQEMLFAIKGINWNDYPAFFKRGTYVQRKVRTGKMTIEELDKLPPLHDARKNPDLEIKRTFIEVLDLPPIAKVENRVDVIIYGKDEIKKII